MFSFLLVGDGEQPENIYFERIIGFLLLPHKKFIISEFVSKITNIFLKIIV
jgi:hypothetical protein